MGHILNRLGEALHLTWIVDARLRVGRQGKGGPDLGVFQSPLAIGVVRDLDLDHLVELSCVSP